MMKFSDVCVCMGLRGEGQSINPWSQNLYYKDKHTTIILSLSASNRYALTLTSYHIHCIV